MKQQPVLIGPTTPRATSVAAAIALVVLVVGGGIAAAHIDPVPGSMEAGTTGTVGFTIEHGCEGSPTVAVSFQVPDGATNVAPVDKQGWTTSITGDVVEFSGGSLAADEEGTFELTLTAPTVEGDINFPIIQTCQQGELAWIEIAAAGAEEPEHPAPTLRITATTQPVTSTTVVATTVVATTTPDSSAAPTTEGATVPLDTAGVIAPTPTTIAVTTTVEATATDDSGTSGGVIAAAVIGAALLVGGGLWLARRKGSLPDSRG